ncbi:hypothetical protein MP638_002619, partial [Amoeboaphelidium occidentale]
DIVGTLRDQGDQAVILKESLRSYRKEIKTSTNGNGVKFILRILLQVLSATYPYHLVHLATMAPETYR